MTAKEILREAIIRADFPLLGETDLVTKRSELDSAIARMSWAERLELYGNLRANEARAQSAHIGFHWAETGTCNALTPLQGEKE